MSLIRSRARAKGPSALGGRWRSVRARLEHILIGAPTRPFADDSPVLAGRSQTRWGAWWEDRPRLLHALALLAILWMVVYLIWRVGFSWHGASPWLWGMLLVCEGYGLWSLSMLTWFSWRLPATERQRPMREHSVDVYICTYDEPLTVLRATLAGCAAMTYPHTTYLLDDGRRAEVAQLSSEWGAEYLTRSDNAHAKAGNINHALPITDGELVLILDADHVPLPDALDAIVGYFDEDDLALVQTPHDFYNHDSIQHYEVGRHEQSVFYGVICPGKDRHNGTFWCGSGALLRRHALLQIGGVAVQTIAEDFHTTIKLHSAGWRSRYHNEVLTQGLAPHDLAAYLLQRDRWARGNLSVFSTPESPLRAGNLTAIQRFSYFASLSSYLAGPMRLLSLMTLAAVLWTGQLPLKATLLTLGALWAPATLLAIAAGSALCRGYQRVADTTHFELCTAEIFIRALRCVVRPGSTKFKVTPKEGVDHGGLAAVRQLRLVLLVAFLLASGLVARILDETGMHLLPNFHGIAIWMVPLVGAFELRRVLRTLTLVARRRQLRSEYRMELDAPAIAVLASDLETPIIARARDISPSGIGLEFPTPLKPGELAVAVVALPDLSGETRNVSLELEVLSSRARVKDKWLIGARITGLEEEDQRRIIEYCYVICQEQRLRTEKPTALPAPVEPQAVPARRLAFA